MPDEAQARGPESEIAPTTTAIAPVATANHPRADAVDCYCFAATFAIALLAYLFTLAGDVTLEWSGMLSTSAKYAAVSPPPGYPAWTLYSWLFTKLLPFSNIAWRVAVGSAVATALACGLIASMVSRVGGLFLADPPEFAQLNPRAQRWLRGVSGSVAGLVLAFSRVVWESAVVADIWGLSLLLFVGALALLLRWTIAPERSRFLFAAFGLFGLLLTSSQQMLLALPGLVGFVMFHHRPIGRDLAVLLLPLAVIATAANQYAAWITFPALPNWPVLIPFGSVFGLGVGLGIGTRQLLSEWKPAVLCGAGLLLGLAVYLYVPLASMANPPVNWGYPRTTEGFFHVLSRGQFERPWPTHNLEHFAAQLLVFGEVTTQKVGWPGTVLAVLALGSLPRLPQPARCWMLGLLAVWLCVGPALVAELNPPPNRQAQELIELYFTASHAVLALWAGVGLLRLGAILSAPAAVDPQLPTPFSH